MGAVGFFTVLGVNPKAQTCPEQPSFPTDSNPSDPIAALWSPNLLWEVGDYGRDSGKHQEQEKNPFLATGLHLSSHHCINHFTARASISDTISQA